MKKTLLIVWCCVSWSAQSQTLIADYAFESDSADASGNGYHLNSHGTGMPYAFVTPSESGATDECVHFQVGQGFVSSQMLDNTGWSGASVAFWIKDSFNVSTGFIIQSGTGFGVRLNSSGNLRVFFDGSSAGDLTSTGSVADGNWHHVVAQSDGNTTYIYIDGALDVSQSETMFQNSGVFFYLGTDNTSSLPVDAFIDDLKIYDDTLSQAQITALATIGVAGISGPEEPIIDFSIYPNPATDQVTLEADHQGICNYVLTDMSGRQINTGLFNAKAQLDVSQLPAGAYLMSVWTGEGRTTKKLILE